MKISTKGRYALTVMIHLGRAYQSHDYLSLSSISEKENISLKYLEKIMLSLKKTNFFEAQKGKDGGYRLRVSPKEITIGSIIRAAEEELDIVDCVKNEGCPNKDKCDTYPLWKGLSDEINVYLDSKNLEEYL